MKQTVLILKIRRAHVEALREDAEREERKAFFAAQDARPHLPLRPDPR